MATRRPRRPPATTQEGVELRIAAKAYDLAEKQIDEGTASAQVITHFLKVQSQRETKELALIDKRTQLLDAQRDALAQAEKIGERIDAAVEAFKSYVGTPANEEPTFD